MEDSILIEKDVRNTPATYTVQYSPCLTAKMPDTYSIVRFFHTAVLDGHVLLREMNNGSRCWVPFGVAHTEEEGARRLEDRALEYAKELQAEMLRKGISATIDQVTYPR